jgi:NAD-dependent SIR2 family protein deacetylase
MKCQKCGKEIPKHEEKMVAINSSHTLEYPYCDVCAALLQQQIDSYPPYEKPKGKP